MSRASGLGPEQQTQRYTEEPLRGRHDCGRYTARLTSSFLDPMVSLARSGRGVEEVQTEIFPRHLPTFFPMEHGPVFPLAVS